MIWMIWKTGPRISLWNTVCVVILEEAIANAIQIPEAILKIRNADYY